MAEVMHNVTPFHYCLNNPVKLVDVGGLYTSTEEMINEAWKATPEDGRGNFYYQDGKKTREVITKNTEEAVNEIITIEGYRDFHETRKGQFGNPNLGKSGLTKRAVNQEPQPFIYTIIMIGGKSVKVAIQYLSGDFVSGFRDAAGMQMGAAIVGIDYYIIYNSNGKVAAYVYVLPESKENWEKGLLIRSCEGRLKAATELNEQKSIDYYTNRLNELKNE